MHIYHGPVWPNVSIHWAKCMLRPRLVLLPIVECLLLNPMNTRRSLTGQRDCDVSTWLLHLIQSKNPLCPLQKIQGIRIAVSDPQRSEFGTETEQGPEDCDHDSNFQLL